MTGMRGRLASAGFRCSPIRGDKTYYDISVPLTFPCCYDVVGNEYSAPNQDILRSKPQLVKYFKGCLALAQAGGAYRTEADREADEGEDARRAILDKVPSADLVVLKGAGLEMTDLRKVSDYCKAFLDAGIPLDTLILNAGIMAVPLDRTAQGHEMHFGVNHLGHFALASLLLPKLAKGKDPRVVVQSSIAHRPASIDFENLAGEHDYALQKFYGQSKLANLMFALELDRRLRGRRSGESEGETSSAERDQRWSSEAVVARAQPGFARAQGAREPRGSARPQLRGGVRKRVRGEGRRRRRELRIALDADRHTRRRAPRW